MFLSIGIVAFMLACIVTWYLRRSAREERRRAEEAAMRVLVETGLAPSGDVFGTFALRGLMHGVEIELTNRAFKRPPGASESDVPTCVTYVAVPVPDQIVCKVAEVDQFMGPLPMVPRVRTGYAPFDATYAVFVGSNGEPLGGSYRSASNASAVPWAQPLLLDHLVELDLLWFRVQEGRAELAFSPLPVKEVARASVLAAAVALASQGKRVPPLSAGQPARWRPWPDTSVNPFWTWFGGAQFGLFGGLSIAGSKDLAVADTIGLVLAMASIGVLAAFLLLGSLTSRTRL